MRSFGFTVDQEIRNTGLKKQWSVFTSCRDISAAAVTTNYLAANDIALASKSCSEDEFVKTCILKAAEIGYSEKLQVFAIISLTRNTAAVRIWDIFSNLDRQLKNKVKSFVSFSVALDESTDISDVAQLAIFIRGVDETLSVSVEFLKLVPMTDTTTDNDTFNAFAGVLNRVGVDWSRAVIITTGDAPSMIGERAGVATQI